MRLISLRWTNEPIKLYDGRLVPAAYLRDGTIEIDLGVSWWLKIYYLPHEIFHYLNHQTFDTRILDYIWDILDLAITGWWEDLAEIRQFYNNY